MKGRIVNSPVGWEPGPPVQSAEGCFYPTWKRVAVKRKTKKKTKKKGTNT